jgi:hypothetical protein
VRDDPDYRPEIICLSCLIGQHPELGQTLDLARQHGSAELTDDGEWVGAPLEVAG